MDFSHSRNKASQAQILSILSNLVDLYKETCADQSLWSFTRGPSSERSSSGPVHQESGAVIVPVAFGSKVLLSTDTCCIENDPPPLIATVSHSSSSSNCSSNNIRSILRTTPVDLDGDADTDIADTDYKQEKDEDEYVDGSLQLDDSAIIYTAALAPIAYSSMSTTAAATVIPSHSVTGLIHIQFHPVYNVLCPYLTLYRHHTVSPGSGVGNIKLDHYQQKQQQCTQPQVQRGPISSSLMDVDEAQSLIDSHFNYNNNNARSTKIQDNVAIDHRIYNFGRLMPDIHPVTHMPCLSLHVCALQDKVMAHINMSSSGSSRTESAYHTGSKDCRETVGRDTSNGGEKYGKEEEGVEHGECEEVNARRMSVQYLLTWLSIVGPHIGLPVSPEFYLQAPAVTVTVGKSTREY